MSDCTCAAVRGASVASTAAGRPRMSRIQAACRASTDTMRAAAASVARVRFVACPLYAATAVSSSATAVTAKRSGSAVVPPKSNVGADEGDVLALVRADDARELAELAAKSPARDRLGVERRLELLEREDELEDPLVLGGRRCREREPR
jgi:hypothetical protein